MSTFTKGLRPTALESLHRLAEEPGQNWWKDLLTLWEPSGSSAGPYGLRLAVRKNYLNFYSRGQSVALVRFTRGREPYVKTHVKYAFGSKETTQAYARLQGTIIRHLKTGEQLKYNGESTLHEWIDQAAEHTGTEKRHVDELVADNPLIIDLEMGLPAYGEGKKVAPRIDCVALEQGAEAIRIVFWEAKMIKNTGLKAIAEPAVVRQVKIYREYLSDAGRAQKVQTAYGNVCDVLTKIRTMAVLLGKKVELDPLIFEAAGDGSNLKVDHEPRLVIFGEKKGNWLSNEERLGKTFNLPYLSFERGPYTFSGPEITA